MNKIRILMIILAFVGLPLFIAGVIVANVVDEFAGNLIGGIGIAPIVVFVLIAWWSIYPGNNK